MGHKQTAIADVVSLSQPVRTKFTLRNGHVLPWTRMHGAI
jgi:hypothetical protein